MKAVVLMSGNADESSWVVLGPDDLGAVLREAREAVGWTQQGLADAAGIHRSYLSDLEQGRTAQQVHRLLRLFRTLDLDVTVSTRQVTRGTAPRDES